MEYAADPARAVAATLRTRYSSPERHEKAKRAAREWRRRNPNQRKENHRRWVAANPDRWRLLKTRVAARRRGQAFDVEYAAILLLDPCAYCGGTAGTIDHVVPVSRGGDGNWENLTAACARCNASKGPRSLLVAVAYNQTEGGGSRGPRLIAL